MFRSLSSRLTAAYVFAAIVLVVIVVAAVTAFALSAYGMSARNSSQELARQVPDEVRMQVVRAGSLRAAAPEIARHLIRPGLHVAVIVRDPGGRTYRFIGMDRDGPPGSSQVLAFESHRPPHEFGGPREPGRGPGGPPPYPPDGVRMSAFPFGLDAFLRIAPIAVAIPGGRVIIVPDPAPLTATINAFWLAMLPIGLFVIGAAWLFGRTIAAQALRPLVETTASLARFGAGDFTPRPVVTSDRNEIGALAEAYNQAAAQVSAAFEERRAAEMQMRQFVADAGHELRTPLTVIMGFIDVLRRRAAHEPATSTKIYETMLVESRRMKALIDKLIVLARMENRPAISPGTVDVAEIANHVVGALQALAPGPRIAIDAVPGAFVRADEHELHDAISNLVENALKYAPDSPVNVRVSSDGGQAVVEVDDRGPGIPEGEQQLIFDRFYRGRDRGDAEGFGLGLAIAKRAVERAGGRLTVASRVGEGTRFTIRLPRVTRGEGVPVAV